MTTLPPPPLSARATRPDVLAQHLAECATGRRSTSSLPIRRAASVRALASTLTGEHHPIVEHVRVIAEGDHARHVTAHVLVGDERLVLGFTVTRDGAVKGALVLKGGMHVSHR